MKYVATKSVRKIGKNTKCITLDCDWGFEAGDIVNITVERTNARVNSEKAD